VLGLALVAGLAVFVTVLLGLGRESALLPADCERPVEEPDTVVLACGDGNLYAEGLDWSDWGGPIAAAEGTAQANTCEPSCADGSFRPYPVVLEAAGLRECPYGGRQYTRVTYTFPADSPHAPEPDPSVPYPCP
jgi:hypothetical protein